MTAGISATSSAQTEPAYPVPSDLTQFAGDFQLPTGDRIIVRVQGEGLTIAAQGEKAAGVLLYGDTFQDSWLWVFQQFNKRAHISINRLISEGMPAFRADLDPALAEEMSDQIADEWATYVEMVGHPEQVKILGSVPDVEGVTVYASIKFEKTHLTWKMCYSLNRMIESFSPVEEALPIKLHVVPISQTTFSGIAVDNRSNVKIEYTFDTDGSANDLTFIGEDHSVLAERISPLSASELEEYVGSYTFSDGSLLRIDRDGDHLRATGVGQEAFARVYMGRDLTSGERARMAHLNARIEDLLKPLLRGDLQDFKKSVNSIGRGPGIGPILQQWQECIDRYGAPRGMHILGAIPMLDDPVCYFAVTFDRTPVVYRAMLTPNLTVGHMEPMASLGNVSVALSPVGEGIFAGCAADRVSPLRFGFNVDQSGQMFLERAAGDTSVVTGVDLQSQ